MSLGKVALSTGNMRRSSSRVGGHVEGREVASDAQSGPKNGVQKRAQSSLISRTLSPASLLAPIDADPNMFGHTTRVLSCDYCRNHSTDPYVRGDLTSHFGNPQVATLKGHNS